MSIEIKILTRKELYDQVWSEPMSSLARKYGRSDVGLAKICKKHNIPRPSRGWWAQKQAGYKVQQVPLPKGNENETIRIAVDPDWASQHDRVRGIVASTSRKKTLPEKFCVSENLADPHPLTAASTDGLASVKPDINGLVPPPQDCLNVHVSLASQPRALRIVNALVKALEARGHDVRVSKESTVVVIHSVSIPIAIGEGLKPERLRAQDHNLEGYYEFGYNKYSTNAPSGRLYLRIVDSDDRPKWPLRQVWRDTENHRLEDILYTFVSGLEKTAAVVRVSKEEHE